MSTLFLCVIVSGVVSGVPPNWSNRHLLRVDNGEKMPLVYPAWHEEFPSSLLLKMVIFSCATSAAAAHDFLWEETKRFGSLQKPVQHFYLEVQLNYQGAFAYLSLLKVNYLFWQYTVFENHQKMSHLNFCAKNGQYCIRRFYFECRRFARIVVKWDFLSYFKTLCLFWGVQLCTRIVGNKKMVVVIADLAWLNGPNRTPGYVWWNLLKTLPRLSCKKRHLTRCFEKAALPPQAKCKIIFLKYGAHLSSS